jgi:glycosidase
MSTKRFIILAIVSFTFLVSTLAQDATLFFSVDMSYQVEQGNFDPEEDFVDLAGTFNDWGSTLIPMADDDQDLKYDVTLPGFFVGQYIEFKFRMNGVWDGNEEFPGGGPNRVHTVLTISDSLYFWYNDEVPPTGPPLASFSAQLTQTQTETQLQFNNSSGGAVTGYEWYFEGGIPETSMDEEPVIVFNSPGTFDVRLIASNDTEADTLVKTDYITVTERDKTELSWWNNRVFYEIFVRSFYDSDGDGIGDFNGMIQKLDYLNDGDPNTRDDLGVQGIWLMPINPSPSYHGYDVTNYKTVNPDYGTMEEFQAFLEAAHERGIKVIIDFVMNHSSTQHPWFIESQNINSDMRDFYRWSETNPGHIGPWGQDVWHWNSSGYYYGIFWGGMPDMNYDHPPLIDSMFQAADYWLTEVGVDGFRLDAVKYIYEDGPTLEDLPETIQFWKDFNAFTKNTAPTSFSVGEAWTNTEQVVQYVEDDGLDYCFEFDLASRMLEAANIGNASGLREQMSMVYSLYPHLQWGSFLTNHDMNRVMNVLGQNNEKHKLAAALYLTLPGIPYLYYGEEIGMLGEKPDENIRRPMQWTDGANAGFTTGTPWHNLNSNYTTYNVATQQEDPNSIWNRYRRLIEIRNLKPSLQTGDYMDLPSNREDVFSFMRWMETDSTIVVINTSEQPTEEFEIDLSFTGLSSGFWSFWNMMTGQWESITIDPSGTATIASLDAMEVKIWSFSMISGIGSTPAHRPWGISLYPNPVGDQITVSFREADSKPVRMKLFSIQGLVLQELQIPNPGASVRIPVTNLEPGLYVLQIESEGMVEQAKFIKK